MEDTGDDNGIPMYAHNCVRFVEHEQCKLALPMNQEKENANG
jgi:hypothetical protein